MLCALANAAARIVVVSTQPIAAIKPRIRTATSATQDRWPRKLLQATPTMTFISLNCQNAKSLRECPSCIATSAYQLKPVSRTPAHIHASATASHAHGHMQCVVAFFLLSQKRRHPCHQCTCSCSWDMRNPCMSACAAALTSARLPVDNLGAQHDQEGSQPGWVCWPCRRRHLRTLRMTLILNFMLQCYVGGAVIFSCCCQWICIQQGDNATRPSQHACA